MLLTSWELVIVDKLTSTYKKLVEHLLLNKNCGKYLGIKILMKKTDINQIIIIQCSEFNHR